MKKINPRFYSLILAAAIFYFALSAVGFCAVESSNYDAIVTLNPTGVRLGSSSNYDIQGIIGQPLIGFTELSGLLDLHFGFAPVSNIKISIIDEYEIYDIQAFSFANGAEALEKTWQRNNDLYFTWKIKPYVFSSMILGYSVSLDSEPDEIVDTTLTYYDGFVYTSISDGKHIFYVKATTTEGTWGEASSFEFWVDTKEPEADNMEPAAGSLLTDNIPTISLSLSDVHSGVDIDSIKLYIDDELVSFTYAEGLVSYTPEVPLDDGSRIVRILAEDLVGNLLDMAWGFTIDASPPTGSITINGGEESTNYARVRLNLEASDEITEVTYMIISNDGVFDDEEWEDFEQLRTDWILAEPQKIGLKTVYCMFRDEADNVSAVYEDSIRLLSAAIDTMITSGPYSPTQETDAEFNYQSSFEDVVFSYKLDTQEWSYWLKQATASFSNLSSGNHVFSVKAAKDLNGDFIITEDEEDPIPAQWTWVIQTDQEPEEGERTLYWRTE